MRTNPNGRGFEPRKGTSTILGLTGRGVVADERRPVRPFRKQASPADRERRAPELDLLLGQVARGDEAAFEQVYDQVVDAVYGLVRRVVRDPAQSQEVVQEVLVEVWRSASRYGPDQAARWRGS